MSKKPARWSPFGVFKPADLRVLGLGLELAAAIGGLGWLGDWLDHRWNTQPWLLLAGIALGTVGGCWNIYKTAEKEGFFRKRGQPESRQTPTSAEDDTQDTHTTQDGGPGRNKPGT